MPLSKTIGAKIPAEGYNNVELIKFSKQLFHKVTSGCVKKINSVLIIDNA